MAKYIFNPETLSYEVKEEPLYVKRLRIVSLILGAAGMVVLSFWLYTSVFNWDLPRTALLKRKHAEWETKINILNRQLGIYEQTLRGIEQRDDDVYRSIFGLSPIPDEITGVELFEDSRYASLNELGANSKLRNTVFGMDEMTRRVYLRSRTLDDVKRMSKEAGDMISCVPNIPPINPEPGTYRISSYFGYRTDPVYGGGERHGGMDFATHTGNPIYATGDAVVEDVSFKFRGYGNEIILDHGYGYKTRYAHLNTIDVSVGMKVKRGEQIGTVGNTGKSTGPHLHYEVIYRNSRVNPLNYMDVAMEASEYKAMIDKRKLESAIGKMSSTGELLSRNRQRDE